MTSTGVGRHATGTRIERATSSDTAHTRRLRPMVIAFTARVATW